MSIRRATACDFLGIAALDHIVWTGEQDRFIPDGEHVWRVWCEYACVWVAEDDDVPVGPWGRIAGAALAFPTTGGEMFLHKIFVHPHCAGRGIGTALLETALREMTVPVLLTVNPANARALALYQKLRFTVRKHIAGFYRPEEDRFLLAWHPHTSH